MTAAQAKTSDDPLCVRSMRTAEILCLCVFQTPTQATTPGIGSLGANRAIQCTLLSVSRTTVNYNNHWLSIRPGLNLHPQALYSHCVHILDRNAGLSRQSR